MPKHKIERERLKGCAFDLHTVASTYLGLDPFGHDQFENTRSEMGELVYQLKYKNDQTAIPKIIALLSAIQGIEKFEAIIPVPSSNKTRPYQPVDEIAKALGAARQVPVLVGYLSKSSDVQLKGINDPEERKKLLESSITIASSKNIAGKRVLLVDDLYRSGATLNACCSVLLDTAKAASVRVLTMTKTRSTR